jgi:hypothetical protein
MNVGIYLSIDKEIIINNEDIFPVDTGAIGQDFLSV